MATFETVTILTEVSVYDAYEAEDGEIYEYIWNEWDYIFPEDAPATEGDAMENNRDN